MRVNMLGEYMFYSEGGGFISFNTLFFKCFRLLFSFFLKRLLIFLRRVVAWILENVFVLGKVRV